MRKLDEWPNGQGLPRQAQLSDSARVYLWYPPTGLGRPELRSSRWYNIQRDGRSGAEIAGAVEPDMLIEPPHETSGQNSQQ